MFSLSRALPRASRLAPCARGFSTKRAKPMKVKKSEARRHVPEKPKPSDALTEMPPPPPPANPFLNNQPPPPQSFGGAMKESFLWGIGMALAFTLVGVIFMEETSSPGAFEASTVLPADQETEEA